MTQPKPKHPKRAPRLVWLLVNARGVAVGVYATKREAVAKQGVGCAPVTVAGPYTLAERVRHR